MNFFSCMVNFSKNSRLFCGPLVIIAELFCDTAHGKPIRRGVDGEEAGVAATQVQAPPVLAFILCTGPVVAFFAEVAQRAFIGPENEVGPSTSSREHQLTAKRQSCTIIGIAVACG